MQKLFKNNRLSIFLLYIFLAFSILSCVRNYVVLDKGSTYPAVPQNGEEENPVLPISPQSF